MLKRIKQSIAIKKSPSEIWKYLVNPALMSQWMGDPEMNIQVLTDWQVGNPILIKGFHHINFENKGTVLQFDTQKVIKYSHLSTISGLGDAIENYSIITLTLTPEGTHTLLTVNVENFPTESIYKHMEFYWRGTVTLLKIFIEQRN